MASMRRLNRRLARWHRYAFKTYWNPRVSRPAWMGPNTAMSTGHVDAWNARELERERRFWDETPEIWLGGPEGEAALIADVLDDEWTAEMEIEGWRETDEYYGRLLDTDRGLP